MQIGNVQLKIIYDSRKHQYFVWTSFDFLKEYEILHWYMSQIFEKYVVQAKWMQVRPNMALTRSC